MHDKLVAKVNNIDTSGWKKIPNTSRLVKKSDYNAKISELENKIPSISGLITTSTLTAVEKKILVSVI